MKYLKYIFLILINNINSVKKEMKIEENSKENKIKKKENKIKKKENEIKKEVYDLLNKYVAEKNITTNNHKEQFNAKKRRIILFDIYEKYKNDKKLINKFSNYFYNKIFKKQNCLKNKEDFKKYDKKYFQQIKKEIYDLLDKYVNENNITIENYKKLVNTENRRILLSDIYEKYKENQSLINEFSNYFYKIIYNKYELVNKELYKSDANFRKDCIERSKKQYEKIKKDKKKHKEIIEKSNDNLYNNKKKAEESILKYIREYINNDYDFFQKNFYEEDKYNIYKWLLIEANKNVNCKICNSKKEELIDNLNDEKALIKSLKERLKNNQDNIEDFENNLEKKEDTYLKEKFEKYYKNKNNKFNNNKEVIIEEDHMSNSDNSYDDYKSDEDNYYYNNKESNSIYDNGESQEYFNYFFSDSKKCDANYFFNP